MNKFTISSMKDDAMGDCDATALAKRIADKEGKREPWLGPLPTAEKETGII